jgi:hypothetical protein
MAFKFHLKGIIRPLIDSIAQLRQRRSEGPCALISQKERLEFSLVGFPGLGIQKRINVFLAESAPNCGGFIIKTNREPDPVALTMQSKPGQQNLQEFVLRLSQRPDQPAV